MATESKAQHMAADVTHMNSNGSGSHDEISQSSHGNLLSRADSPALKSPGLLERVQARVRPDEQYREEIVRSIFGEVGTPVEDFSCAVVSRILLHGRMYVTSSFVCFYSNLFGFEKIVKIPFCHMRCITKEKTALFIPNAIAIITSRKEYIFRSFWDREDAFRTLKNCHQASLRQGSPTNSEDLALRETELIEPREAVPDGARLPDRATSDNHEEEKDSYKPGQQPKRRLPWAARSDRLKPALGPVATGNNDEDDLRKIPSVANSITSSGVRTSFGLRVSVGAAPNGEHDQPAPSPSKSNDSDGHEDDSDVAVATGNGTNGDIDGVLGATGEGGANAGPKGAGAGPEDEHSRRSSLDIDSGGDSEVDVLGVEGSPVHAVSLGESTGGGRAHTKMEEFKLALQSLGEGWLAGAEGGNGKADGSRGVATSRLGADLPCNLQVFFETFIANDAEKGLPGFHESIGDSDVRATPWKVSGGGLGMTREIRFVHPVSAPIGPSSTRAVKLQRCRTYGEHGLIIETSTHLEDIVMSDYFQIEDRCVVQPDRDGPTVRVDVEIEVKFFKSTMLRKAIETKSLNETREVWESFVNMAKDTLKTRVATRELHDSGQDSEDEGLIRRTRERLRERRKHRQRHRHHPAPPPPPHPHDAKTVSQDEPVAAPRPRVRSAASGMSSTLIAEGASADGRTTQGHIPTRVDKESNAMSSANASVSKKPMIALRRHFASPAGLAWTILGIVLIWEFLQYLYFASETAGFLEAAEGAMFVLQNEVIAGGQAKEGKELSADSAASLDALKQELAQRLVSVYARNRFLWPLNTFFR